MKLPLPDPNSSFSRYLKSGSDEDAAADHRELETHANAHTAAQAARLSEAHGDPALTAAIHALTALVATLDPALLKAKIASEVALTAAVSQLCLEVKALRGPRTRTGRIETPEGPVEMHITDTPAELRQAADAMEKVTGSLGQPTRRPRRTQ